MGDREVNRAYNKVKGRLSATEIARNLRDIVAAVVAVERRVLAEKDWRSGGGIDAVLVDSEGARFV